MSSRKDKLDCLAEDKNIGPILQLPEFKGWLDAHPTHLDSLIKTVPWPYGEPYEVPEVARLDAITSAIVRLKQRLGNNPDLRVWLNKDEANRSKLSMVMQSAYYSSISDGYDEISALYEARENYAAAIATLQGPQKTRAEQALKQLDKDLQPAINEKLEGIAEGFLQVKADQEAALAVPDLPDSIRYDIEVARDLCDLAAMHLRNRSLKLGNSVEVGS